MTGRLPGSVGKMLCLTDPHSGKSVRKQRNEFSFQSLSGSERLFLEGFFFSPSPSWLGSGSGLDPEQWLCVFAPAANQIKAHGSPHLHADSKKPP